LEFHWYLVKIYFRITWNKKSSEKRVAALQGMKIGLPPFAKLKTDIFEKNLLKMIEYTTQQIFVC
jgi:hypothetical protein